MRIALLCLLLAGCNTLPTTVTVVEKEFQPIDPIFTDTDKVENRIPVPKDGTVGARVLSHDQRGHLLEVWACHRKLLARMSKGEKVDKRECDI